tara:strand:+ start:106197 stop:107333 length:1137 start_codon:yes stop_codon:yes gene_type:complete
MPKYDFLIVGAGLFGSVFARQLTDAGARCRVIEKRNHIGGNCYTENQQGIHVHRYGPHIFHTNNETIWEYVNRFVSFNRFTYRPRVNYRGRFYSFPINLMTLNQLWGVTNPFEANQRLKQERVAIENPSNLEEWALSQVGRELYETFIYGYTKKQWGCEPSALPTSIIRRIPVRLTWNDDYFNDTYCGIPKGGYTQLFDRLLEGIPVEYGVDFIQGQEHLEKETTKVVYTGPLDCLFDFQFGANEWRGLKFEHQTMDVSDYQGVAAINYTDHDVPYTRTIEHKHFDAVQTSHTVVTKEYPAKWEIGNDMYYPINQSHNEALQKKYFDLLPDNYITGGRLAEYKYYDMHQVIGSALKKAADTIRAGNPSRDRSTIRFSA